MEIQSDRNKPGSILIVDDEEIALEVISEMIKELHYGVYKANSGKKAVKIFKEYFDEIDLVIIDLVMPDVDCESLFLELKKVDPACKFLLMTGFDKNEAAEKMIDLGVDGYIQKPCTMDALFRAIESLISA